MRMCLTIKSIFWQWNGFPYKMHVFDEMQFVSHCYTVVSYQAIFRHSMYKNPAVYFSSASVGFFARYEKSVPRLHWKTSGKTKHLLQCTFLPEDQMFPRINIETNKFHHFLFNDKIKTFWLLVAVTSKNLRSHPKLPKIEKSQIIYNITLWA